MRSRLLVTLTTLLLGLVGLSACSSDETSSGGADGSDSSAAQGEKFPDVKKVEVEGSDGTYTFDVTISSPYDSPERYADNIRIRSADGETTYGERKLVHDHASEQPFTRSASDVQIPDDVDEVVVEGHDQVSGWGGDTKTVTIEH